MTVHRRPVGRGRWIAAISAVVIVVGCVPPWWTLGGADGIPAISGNAFEGPGIVVFLVGLATLALVALPYAAGDRPVGLDRWVSYAALVVVGAGAFVIRLAVLASDGALGMPDRAPGLWLTGAGLLGLAVAAGEIRTQRLSAPY